MAGFTTRRTLTSLLSRTLRSTYSRSRFGLPLLDHHYQRIPVRLETSGSGYSPLKDPSPKETTFFDGLDYEHWLILMEFPTHPKPSKHDMIDAYVKTLASVLQSEEEAKKKIYSVSTTTYTGFGALISKELSNKLKGLPGVLRVLPDSYLDIPTKDYGGDLFIDGKVIPQPDYRFANQKQKPRRYGQTPQYIIDSDDDDSDDDDSDDGD